jgi:16S rRNA (guanine966-N2)-methyltransferase
MKDRVREAVFSLLGDDVVGAHAVDLFAGSGALGLETLSRGGVSATFVEQHFPTAATLRQNCVALGVADVCDVEAANTLLWAERCQLPSDKPWVVFCSPPYAFFVERREAMLALVERLLAAAPIGSAFVVEADEQVSMGELPDAAAWDLRFYPPAVIAIYRKRP